MRGALMVVLVLAVPMASASTGPEEWIARLGSPRYAEREEAAAGLQALGRAALPALEASREHRDPEVRSRVNALVAKIEGSLLLESTPVVLDFRDRPLGEVVRDLGRRADLPIALAPGAPASRRVTLRAEGPVPFWTAVDRLADAADLGYAFPGPVAPNLAAPALTFATTAPRPSGPMSDHGPFRVNLMSLHYQRDVAFLGPVVPGRGMFPAQAGGAASVTTSTDGRATSEQFYLRLQAAAEPRLTLRQTGPLKLATAVDDLGQSLVPAAGAAPGGAFLVQYGMAAGPLQFSVGLRHPESPGRAIRLIRGSIPVAVSTRRPGPLVVALDGAKGKSFRNDDVTLVVDGARPIGPRAAQSQVEVTIVPQPSRAPIAAPANEFDPFQRHADVGPLQIELADASGRPVGWYLASTQQDGDQTRVTLTTTPGPGGTASAPTTLRYYGSIRSDTEIPFEFRDVPMP